MPLSRIQQGGNSDPLIINNVVASGLVVNGTTTTSGLVVTGNESINGSLTISGGLTVRGTVGSLVLSGSITTPSTALVLQQTGDQFGTTQLQIQNRNGLNGILVSNPSIPLVDYGSLPQNYLVPADFRAEGRVGSTYSANTTSGIEYQMWPAGAQGATTAPAFAVSAYAAIFTVPVQLTSPTLQGAIEKFGVFGSALSASTPATMNGNQATLYMATAATPTATWTVNLQNCPTVSGQSITFAITVLNGSTAYLPSNITINGVQAGASSSALPAHKAVNNNITTYYQGGTAWSAADTSELDVYTFTAMCTASGVYTLLLGLNKF